MRLLIFGNRTNDIIIEAGDVIAVDPAKNFISLTGQVKDQLYIHWMMRL